GSVLAAYSTGSALVWIVWVGAVAACLASAVAVVSFSNPFYSALALIGNLGSLAVLYLLLSAEFVAAAQVLVYAGAVMVMFLFVIAYLGGQADAPWAGAPRRTRGGEPLRVKGPDVTWYLAVAAFLFAVGALGVLIRRSPLIVLLSLEIMLNGANLALIAFSRRWGHGDGQVFTLAVMAVAASEVVVGLGLIVAMGRRHVELDVDKLRTLRG